MNLKKRLTNFRSGRNCTLLGVGPMSKNCIDATIELAGEHDVPLMLIASRRQIDSEQFGGGYVVQRAAFSTANAQSRAVLWRS